MKHTMRLDLFLKTSRLVKRRTIAQEMCIAGRVQLNGHDAKPAKEVRPGDVITLKFSSRIIDLNVLEIPISSKKASFATCYAVKSETRLLGDKALWSKNP